MAMKEARPFDLNGTAATCSDQTCRGGGGGGGVGPWGRVCGTLGAGPAQPEGSKPSVPVAAGAGSGTATT